MNPDSHTEKRLRTGEPDVPKKQSDTDLSDAEVVSDAESMDDDQQPLEEDDKDTADGPVDTSGHPLERKMVLQPPMPGTLLPRCSGQWSAELIPAKGRLYFVSLS